MSKYICECGKDCRNPNALELHKKFCKGIAGQEGERTCPVCGTEMRLLDEKNVLEKKAIQMGYLEVCKNNECMEVI